MSLNHQGVPMQVSDDKVLAEMERLLGEAVAEMKKGAAFTKDNPFRRELIGTNNQVQVFSVFAVNKNDPESLSITLVDKLQH
jgi:hypothetical protein